MRKKLLMLIACLVMAGAIQMGAAFGLETITNVELSDDGVLTCDRAQNPATYLVLQVKIGYTAVNVDVLQNQKTVSVDLAGLAANWGYASGDYEVVIFYRKTNYAHNEWSVVSEPYTLTYHHTAKMGSTTEIWFDCATVCWNEVKKAEYYEVYLTDPDTNTKVSPTFKLPASRTSCDMSTQMKAGNRYRAVVRAFAEGYIDGDPETSGTYSYVGQETMKGVEWYNQGQLHWEQYPGATKYVLKFGYDTYETTDTKYNVLTKMTEKEYPGGDYELSIYAMSGKKNIISKVTKITYQHISNKVFYVDFDANGGSGVMRSAVAKSPYVVPGCSYRAPDGCAFKYWKLSGPNTIVYPGNSITLDKDIILVAVWEHRYTLSFQMNGHGKQIASKTLPENGSISLPTNPTEEGWIFEGWYTDAKLTTPFQYGSIKANMTLYAKWTEDKAVEIESLTNAWYGVTLKWKPVGGYFTVVYRKAPNESNWTELSTTDTNGYYDKTAKNNTVYSYALALKKKDTGVTCNKGNAKSILFMAPPTISSVSNVSGGVQVTWSAVEGADGYFVYRKDTQAGTWHMIGSTQKNLSFTDRTVSSGVVYYYAVKSFRKDGDANICSASSSARNTIYLKNNYISKLSNSAAGILNVEFSKTPNCTGYEIVYGLKSNLSDGITVPVKTATAVNKTISGLKKGTTYYVKVRAYKTMGGYTFYSEWSAVKSLTLTK